MTGQLWRYRIQRRTAASPEIVWRLIGHAERWSDWSFLTRALLLREGAPDRNGVGALRRFAVGPFGSSEEVVEYEPPRHLAYVARRGMPVKSYRADVILHPDGGGTLIEWRATMVPLIPGTGGAVLAYARGFVSVFLRQLVRYADGLAAGPGS